MLGVALVGARRARQVRPERVAAVGAQQAVHRAVARGGLQPLVRAAVDAHGSAPAVHLPLPRGVARARVGVARYLDQLHAVLVHGPRGHAGAVLGDLGAHVAAHGHFHAVAHGEVAGGVAVLHHAHAVALQPAHGPVQRPLGRGGAGVHPGDGLCGRGQERVEGALLHVQVVALQDGGETAHGGVHLARPLLLRSGPAQALHVVGVGRPHELLDGGAQLGVHLAGVALDDAAQLVGVGLAQQRRGRHALGRDAAAGQHEVHQVVQHVGLYAAVHARQRLAGLLQRLRGQHQKPSSSSWEEGTAAAASSLLKPCQSIR